MIKVLFRDDYKGGPTILFVGSAPDAVSLANYLKTWSQNPRNERLSEVGTFQMLDSIEVEMADGRPYEIRGMMRNLHNSYRWIITSEEACLFAEMAQALADSNIPSHAYLETEDGELGVILSKDEFEVP